MYCRVTQQDIYWDEAQRYANEISVNMSKFFKEHIEYATQDIKQDFKRRMNDVDLL